MIKNKKIAVICMTSGEDKKKNILAATGFVRSAAGEGAEVIQLPEMFSYIGPKKRQYEMAEDESGELSSTLSSLARELGITLFAGSVGERVSSSKKIYNTSYVFGPTGSLLAKYRKIHLFSIKAGGRSLDENDSFLPGDAPVSFQHEGFRTGLTTCYDLRFPELFAALSKDEDPDLYSVPSAFTKQTGQKHWSLLLRARAIERQAYLFAAAQTGDHGYGRESYGHAMIIDPFGEVLANTGEREGVAMAEISKETIERCRSEIPALKNRRKDIY